MSGAALKQSMVRDVPTAFDTPALAPDHERVAALLTTGHAAQALQLLRESPVSAEALAGARLLRLQATACLDLGDWPAACNALQRTLEWMARSSSSQRRETASELHALLEAWCLLRVLSEPERGITTALPSLALALPHGLRASLAQLKATLDQLSALAGQPQGLLGVVARLLHDPAPHHASGELARWAMTVRNGTVAEDWHAPLWLGLGFMACGYPRSAAECLSEVIDSADAAGDHRTRRHATELLARTSATQRHFEQAYQLTKGLLADWRETAAELAVPPSALSPAGLAVDARHANPHVQRAVEFMRRNLTRRFQADDVARHCGVSRRTLEMAFKAELSSSTMRQARLMRMELAFQRLVEGGDSVKRVAIDLGYPSAGALSREFRRVIGESVSNLRRRAGRPIEDDEQSSRPA